MGEFLLNAIIIAAVVLAIVLFIGFSFSLAGVVRSFLGTDTRSKRPDISEDIAGQVLLQQMDEWKFKMQCHPAHLDPDRELSALERDELARLLDEGKWYLLRARQLYLQYGLDTAPIEEAEAELRRVKSELRRS